MPSKHKSEKRFIQVGELRDTHGSHRQSLHVVDKIGKDGRKRTRYVRKLVQSLDDPRIAELEAIAGDMYRLFGGVDLTPKVRVIRSFDEVNHEYSNQAVVSGIIENFEPIGELLEANRHRLLAHLREHQRELAKLLVTSYLLAENDLHIFNWGLNDERQITKIDHDQALFPIAAELLYNYEATGSREPFMIERWPNAACPPTLAFQTITFNDIMNFPDYFDTRPANHIFNTIPEVATLCKQTEFIRWKYFYFVKALFFTEANLTAIINDHTENTYLAERIKTYLTTRLSQLRQKLLQLSDFRTEIMSALPFFSVHLHEELALYNAQFLSKDGVGMRSIIKESTLHRHLSLDSIDIYLHELQDSAEAIETLDNTVKEREYLTLRLSEFSERFEREERCLENMRIAYNDISGKQKYNSRRECLSRLMHNSMCTLDWLRRKQQKLNERLQIITRKESYGGIFLLRRIIFGR